MTQIKEMLRDIHAYEEKKSLERKTEAGKLVERIMSKKKTNEEWMKLKKDVNDFLISDAPDEDKRMLRGYTETLSMVCNAIEEGRI